MSRALPSLALLLLLAACQTSGAARPTAAPVTPAGPAAPVTPAASGTAGGSATPAAPGPAAAPAAPGQQLTLRLRSAPSQTVGTLAITLLAVSEVAIAGPSGPRFKMAVRLLLQRGDERREVQLEGPLEALGHRISLVMAGDGQATPHSPREQFAIVRVVPLR